MERFLIQRPLRAAALLCSDFAPITAHRMGREAGPYAAKLVCCCTCCVSFKNKRSTSEIDFAVALGFCDKFLVDYFRPSF